MFFYIRSLSSLAGRSDVQELAGLAARLARRLLDPGVALGAGLALVLVAAGAGHGEELDDAATAGFDTGGTFPGGFARLWAIGCFAVGFALPLADGGEPMPSL